MGKTKKETDNEPEAVEVGETAVSRTGGDAEESAVSLKEELSYEDLVERVCPIAKPLASKKLTKRVYKTAKKASKAKSIRRGVREVVKSLRKGEKGLVVLAGDVSPIDVITHIPVYCEDKSIPYVYIPSRRDLGSAIQTKRPTSAILIKKHTDFESHFTKCFDEVKALPLPI